MRSGDDVGGDELTQLTHGFRACVNRGGYRSHVAPHDDRDVGRADLLLAHECHVRGFKGSCINNFRWIGAVDTGV